MTACTCTYGQFAPGVVEPPTTDPACPEHGHRVDWHALTEAFAREYRSRSCKDDQHAPAPGCDEYYPPGPDTYRCLCACHHPPFEDPHEAIAAGQTFLDALAHAGTVHVLDVDDTARCRRCRTRFDETDHQFNGAARHAGSPWCKRCVDRCHEATEFDHTCPICTDRGSP